MSETEQGNVEQTNQGSETEATTTQAQTIDAAVLARYREAIVTANPDAIPELIAGADFAGIDASVEGAKAAYARVAETVKSGGVAQPPKVPAGGQAAAAAVNVEGLSPQAKISHGLQMKRQARSA